MSAYKEYANRIAKNRRARLLTRQTFNIVGIIIIIAAVSYGSFRWSQDEFAKERKSLTDFGISISKKMGLTLENIYISGQKNLATEKILSAMSVHQGEPILALALDDIKNELKNLGWVKDISVERQLPSTLHIRIIERQPVAIWQYKKELSLVDIGGNLITRGETLDYADLPILVGEDAYQHTGALFNFLATEPEIFRQVSAMIRVGGRRWNIRLNNGIEIMLPEQQPDAAWKYLAKMQKEKNLLNRDVETVDLRLADRIFVKNKN